jgi:NAD(P)H-dependent FMN reductase
MTQRKVVILDGAPAREESLERMLASLIDEVERGGAEVQVIAPRDFRLDYCKGCFGCWLETPGSCVEDEAGSEILGAIVRCDELILFTPVSFGGYSSGLKLVVDHFVSFTLPFFGTYHGETHHPPRYPRFPRLVGVGVLNEPSDESARIFRALVGRNALNFHAPSHAAELVLRNDPPESLRERFRALLARNEELPVGDAVTSLLPPPGPEGAGAHAPGSRRALLIVGSPKAKKPSTSGVLGGYLMKRLEESGWRTESLTLRLRTFGGQRLPALFDAVDAADLVVVAFPLYIDALPYLVTRALERIAEHRRDVPPAHPQSFVAIANNGFPEAFQNAPALAICRRFAAQSGFAWAGALALGAGEALSSGRPLTPHPKGGRPPVGHVMKALDLAGEALAAGRPVPEGSVRLIAANPIPLMPFAAWRWIFVQGGEQGWRREAATHGVTPEEMLKRPYQITGPTLA